jgi:drug/metabolite transporter (DMT)-like permease
MVFLALLLVQLLLASIAVVGRLVLPVVSPGVVVACRILGAAAALLLLNAARGGPWIRDRGTLVRLAAAGSLGITANQSLFLFGLNHTTAVNASLLVTTAPVFTVLGSLLFRLERPSPFKLTGIALSALGAIYLVGPDRLSFAPGVALGNLLILLAMLCYAGYFLIAKPLLARHDALTVGAYVMLFASVGILPVGLPALAAVDPGRISGTVRALVGYLVIGPTIAAYLLNLWALRRASYSTVAGFIFLQPFFAALGAAILLPGEGITARMLVAASGIFLGLGLVLRAEAAEASGVPAIPRGG